MPLRRIRNPYNFEKCRSCSHYFLSHTVLLPSGNIICEWGNSSYKPHHCECTEFLPKDNLEFLEMKYERSKLAIDLSNKSNEDMPTQ